MGLGRRPEERRGSARLAPSPRPGRTAAPPGAPTGVRSVFSSLRYPDFRLVWIGMLGWSGAMWMENIARNWLVWKLTDSALELGLTNLVRSLPQVFLALPAGVMADRFNKKWVLLISQSVTFVSYLIIFGLVITETVEMWHIYVLAAVMGASMAFNQPARHSLIPRLVPPGALLNAMALTHVAMNVTRVVGPGVAGLLIWADGGNVRTAYGAAVAIFLVVLVATVLLRESEGRSMSRGSARAQLMEGLNYVAKSPSILAITIVSLVVFTFAMPYNTLLPVIADEVFGIGPGGYGLLLSVAGAGALAGGLGIAALGDFSQKGLLLLGGGMGFGLLLVVLGLAPWVGVAFVAMLLLGACQSLFMAAGNTLILNVTPAALQGRVMSVYALDHALMPLGGALAGGLAEAADASTALVVMGAACTVLVLVTTAAMPRMRHL